MNASCLPSRRLSFRSASSQPLRRCKFTNVMFLTYLRLSLSDRRHGPRVNFRFLASTCEDRQTETPFLSASRRIACRNSRSSSNTQVSCQKLIPVGVKSGDLIPPVPEQAFSDCARHRSRKAAVIPRPCKAAPHASSVSLLKLLAGPCL